MRNVLFLDDSLERLERARKHYPQGEFSLCLVKTASDCIDALKQGKWDIVSLDHDLGDEIFQDSDREDCGMEVVRFLLEHKMHDIDLIIIHSWNLPAAKAMDSKLRSAGYFVERKMFGM